MFEETRNKLEEFEEDLDHRQKKLYSSFKFLIKLLLLSIPLYILLYIEWDPVMLRSFKASVVGQIVSFLGLEIEQYSTFVVTERFTLDVTRDSTAWKSMLAVAALVLATEFRWKKKIKGAVIGVVFVFVVNIIRISSMIFMVIVLGFSYEMVHTFLWRWGLTFFIFLYWYFWLIKERKS